MNFWADLGYWFYVAVFYMSFSFWRDFFLKERLHKSWSFSQRFLLYMLDLQIYLLAIGVWVCIDGRQSVAEHFLFWAAFFGLWGWEYASLFLEKYLFRSFYGETS